MPDVPGVVVDASAIVDLLAPTSLAGAVRRRLDGVVMHAPCLLDAEVLSALGRLSRAGVLDDAPAARGLAHLVEAPITRHPLPALLAGAWARRADLRSADSLYVELATHLGLPLVTTDLRLARATSVADPITDG